jgi:Xaa-Pro aminopeptidase
MLPIAALCLAALAAPTEAPPVGKYLAPLPEAKEKRTLGPTGALGPEVYRARRKALVEATKGGLTLVINELRFDGLREGMDFYFLTGIDEPGAALLLDGSAADRPEILFLAPLDVEADRVSGERALLPSQAIEAESGIADVLRIGRLAQRLVNRCAKAGGLNFVGDLVASPRPKPPVLLRYQDAVERAPGCKVNDLHGLLGRMREVKSAEELALLRRAIEHTAAGHKAIVDTLQPGQREFEVKDVVEAAFKRSGSRHVAYDSIVGSGPNGAVLHYPKDNRVMKPGELLVADVGAEEQYYATDVTRTYPISGVFTPEQREVYQIVLKAQAAAIAVARPGVLPILLEKAARKVIDDAGYHDAYIHGCCHFVGLEVHDAGDYDAPLPVGAVLTVEPGIYLPQRGFGVRIEDEILITAGGAEVITRSIPKDPDEIERLMKARTAK